MSSAAPPRRPAPARGKGGRRPSPLAITAIAVGVVVVALFLLAQFWTEVMWFDQLGYEKVIWTQWGARAALFAGGFLVMGGAVWGSLQLAYRNRPIYAPSTPEQATLDQYREAVEPLRKLVMIAAPVLVGLFAGVAASSQWTTVLLALNSVPFGTDDPQFGIDLSFFVFTLPALRFVAGFLVAVVIISGIAALATLYLYGGLRIADGGVRTTRAARVQLAVLAALLMALIGLNYWLDRYSLLKTDGEKFAGASFTDVNAVIPAKAILAGVAVLVAVLFIVTAVRGSWRLPAIGVGLMVVSAIVIGGVYPAVVQRFQATPNAQTKEAEYIQRNIDATRNAFGLDGIEVEAYDAKTTAEAGALRADAETTASIRLLDPTIVSPSFRQLQQNRGYYNFADTLSVDRYIVDGESRDTVIAVRELELSGLGAGQRNWVNDHTVYTHGFGVVAAYGNQIGPDGRPAFFEGGIPSVGALTDLETGGYEPRIYFSPKSPSYSIVGAPEGTDPWELDYPTDDTGGQVDTTFPTEEIAIGPKVGTFLNKMLFALKFQSEEILFSDRVTDVSQIVYDRDPRDRVAKVAPYLTLDGRVYPAVVDGKVVWIVDGYTTSDEYPYSASESLEDATTDSLTATSMSIQAQAPQQVNYIRNSVKATVDAYDGSVTLYAWDAEDPVLQAWQGVFPNTVKPVSEISGDLMSHIRYPEDMFKVQRSLLTKYHVTTASEFFSGQDFWRSPDEPTLEEGEKVTLQPPYYQTLQMPGQEAPTFSLSSSFITGGTTNRNVLTGYLAVNAEAGNVAGVPDPDYGQLRLLELPRGSTVPGPGQVQNNFDSDPEIGRTLNLLRQGNSVVKNGNLLTLPMGGGLLYVQPVYVQSTSSTQFPLLRKVLVAFGDEVGFADTLDAALDQVFAGDSGATAGDATTPDEGQVPVSPTPPTDTPTDTPTDAPTDTPTEAPAGDAQARLSAALSDAKTAMEDSQAALSDGDFAAYGDAQARLQAAVEAALAAEAELG